MKNKPPSPIQTLFLGLLDFYRSIRPWWVQIQVSFFGFAPVCRQTPSCSEFTRQEILAHGTITGLKRGFQRVISCHS